MTILLDDLAVLSGGDCLKATVAKAAAILADILKGHEYRIGAFRGEGDEIELHVVMPSTKKTLELAFSDTCMRATLISATGVLRLPTAYRHYEIRAYAEWLFTTVDHFAGIGKMVGGALT